MLEGARPTEVFRPTGAPSTDAPLRIRHHKLRSLVHDAARLEMRHGGLVIDMGTPDQHKYLPPGQKGEIGVVERDGSNAVVEIRGEVTYKVDIRGHPVEHVLIRARAAKGKQTLSLYLDGTYVTQRSLTTTWKTQHFRLNSPLNPGVHIVKLSLPDGRHDMWLDWVYLRDRTHSKTRNPSLDKVALRHHGTPMPALVGDPPRTYSIWTEVPPEGVLLFDHASDTGARFEVSVVADHAGTREVLDLRAGVEYHEASVDLSPWSGEVVRLELRTEGRGTASWGDPWIARPGRPPQRRNIDAPRPRGMIMLVIDTIRQDIFRVYNPRTPVATPSFDALAKDARVFDNAYSTAPWTKPAVTTILTSLYPSSHGAQSEIAKLSPQLTLLSEILKEQGFTTALFSANGYVSDYFGFTQGWDHFVNLPRKKERTQAKDVFERVLAWLENLKSDEPFFLYIQTVDPHVPYQTPSRFLSKYLATPYEGPLAPAVSGYELNAFNDGTLEMDDADRAYVLAMYNAEVSYHDEYMGLFVDKLKTLKLLDDLVLVVTSDHGEELFDHGKLDHGHSLHEELIRAPLLIRHPSSVPPGRFTPAVSIIDIAPTVLEILGVRPPAHMQGRSLLAALQGALPPFPAYAIAERGDRERSIRLGPYKLIYSTRGAPELYDLRHDPKEQRDIAKRRPLALRACEMHLFEGLRIPRALDRPNGMSVNAQFEAGTAKPDSALMRHLRALGYFSN